MRVFLLDGMAILFRSYYALLSTRLTAKSGEPTGATFGFCSALLRLLDREKPDVIAVAWDSKEPTFRHDQFDAYKANRGEFPEDLVPQLERVKQIIGLYAIPSIQLPGYEADDIIGTLAIGAANAGNDVFCVTSDKDFMQLVNDRIRVYRPAKPGAEPEIIGYEGVYEKFGVKPEQVIDVLALMGDSSDNVPGVKGIGEKTAIPLIQQFGSVEELYANLDKVEKAGIRKKLEADKAGAELSKELVTIHTQVPLDVTLDSLHQGTADIPAIISLYSSLGFSSLVARYPQHHATEGDATQPVSDGKTDGAETSAVVEETESGGISFDFGANIGELMGTKTIHDIPHTYTTVTTEEQLAALIPILKSAPILSFDLETDGLDWQTATIIGIALSVKEHEGYYVAIAQEERADIGGGESLFDTGIMSATDGISMEVALRHLAPLLEDPELPKTGQNAKFDMLMLIEEDVTVRGLVFDSMLASYVLDSTQQHGMDALSVRFLNYTPVSITELIGSGKEQRSMREVPLEVVSEYASEDADITLQLHNALKPQLEHEGLLDVLERYDVPLVEVLTKMEHTGIAIDVPSLRGISSQLEETAGQLEIEIYELAGRRFTINSPKQLSEILFDELKLPVQKKTKTGYSTDQFVMEELATLHPLPEKILEYRQAIKLKSTYVDALPDLINPKTRRIHTSYNQALTSTGRLSSNNPNLQNIPIRTDTGREIRKAFIPGIPNGKLLSADYSQVELRIMAHVCGDEALVNAFANDEDIHAATAMNIFGVPAEEVTSNMRRKAKAVNFGIMYGIGPFGLARQLKTSKSEAAELITLYFQKYPGVQEYINSTLMQAREKGYVQTLTGRRRYYPNINVRNAASRSAEERAAINMPIQGTASEIIKAAMIVIHNELPKHFPDAAMLLQVHDELIFEAPEDQMDDLSAFVKEKMEGAFDLGKVRLVVDTGVGDNWYEAH